MRYRARHDRAAAGRAVRASALALLVAAPFVLGGCHDEQRLRERLEGPTARLPVEPDQPETPPAPALLDTVRPWQQPKLYAGDATDAWGLVTVPAVDDMDLTYRVPQTWEIRTKGRARNLGQDIEAYARLTNLEDSDISLATYAAQLAEGNPIFQYTTSDGHIVYVTRREVALAPSDPEAPREVFHTAALSIDGHIAKIDVRYDSELNWRFDTLADAITGTLQVRPHAA
ncbi:MAG: hypothetical protein KDC46_00885 [Thermoleophilia bacterium]|nr:hypothetical protein [Thermoleophilia bacterium]